MYGTLKKIFAFAGSKKELLKKSLLFSFLSGLFSAMQFAALFVVIGALVSDNRDGSIVWISLGIMALSLIGRIITTYFSTMEQTETGYCMVAEKRIHIGDRLRYIPMGYFNKNSIKQIVVRVFSVLLLLTSVWFWLDGSLPLAYGLILVIASFMVFNDLENAGNMASLLQMLVAAMDTANSIDDTPVMDEKGADITPKSSEIVFDKVDFSYADRKILDQVSFTITEKTTTAIVGPSGAGKTTMCNLIARFWDVNAGKITIGGTDVRDFKLDSLMKNISMVFQSVYLFADTIENNIKFGCPDATHEQVVEAAKKACCHNFISALPDGYDTVIGEGGGTLSGGEKQRISIARAMLKDAPIIILDEATSSVDPENEDELQRAIEALTHDKTIIMIAHRLKTVRNADQILVLDNAHIVQRGTHAELIQQKGLYADFVSARQEAIGWKLAQ